jgi:thiol-disulfide isomerase/thioredoxin
LTGDSQPTQPLGSLRFLAFCGLVMLVGIMFLAWLGSPPIHSAVGKKLPALDLVPLVETEKPLQSEFLSDSLTILHLWGPWSEECRQSFPELVEVMQKFADRPDIRVISVVFPKDVLIVDELRSQTLEFLEGQSIVLPNYIDTNGTTSVELALLMPYGSLGFPTTIVADRTGTIIEVIDGYQPDQMRTLPTLLSSRLGQQPSQVSKTD